MCRNLRAMFFLRKEKPKKTALVWMRFFFPDAGYTSYCCAVHDECYDVNGYDIRSWARHICDNGSVEGSASVPMFLGPHAGSVIQLGMLGKITCDLVIFRTGKSACAECNNNVSARWINRRRNIQSRVIGIRCSQVRLVLHAIDDLCMPPSASRGHPPLSKDGRYLSNKRKLAYESMYPIVRRLPTSPTPSHPRRPR